MDFRCSAASLAGGEPLAGTAPTERAWLFVEYAGPWGGRAVQESRLPARVRQALTGLDGFRVQLIRSPAAERTRRTGVQVVAATATPHGFAVGAVRLAGPASVPELVTALDAEAPAAGLPSYDGPLWLVCTNGRRDRCCAELGRPVAAAVAEAWPDATWETTHLGGHRFAGTLLALPSGLTLARLTPASAVAACAAVLAGDPPVDLLRGRAGLAPAAQVAELSVRALHPAGPHVVGEHRAGAAGVLQVAAGAATYAVTVAEEPGPARRQSCRDGLARQTSTVTATSVTATSVTATRLP